MPDSTTTLADLRAAVAAFVTERDWRSSTTPRIWQFRFASRLRSCWRKFQWHDAAQGRRPAVIPRRGNGRGWNWPTSWCIVCA